MMTAMQPIKILLLAGGLALILGGLFVGLTSPSVAGFDCGAPLANSNSAAIDRAGEIFDEAEGSSSINQAQIDELRDAIGSGSLLVAACDDALSDRRVVAWPLLIGGLVLGIIGLVVPRRQSPPPAAA